MVMNETHPQNPFAVLSRGVRAIASMIRTGAALGHPIAAAHALDAARRGGRIRPLPAQAAIPAALADSSGGKRSPRRWFPLRLPRASQFASAAASGLSLAQGMLRAGEWLGNERGGSAAPLTPGEAADRRASRASESAGEGAVSSGERLRRFHPQLIALESKLAAALTRLGAATRAAFSAGVPRQIRSPLPIADPGPIGAQVNRSADNLARAVSVFARMDGGERARMSAARSIDRAGAIGSAARAASPRAVSDSPGAAGRRTHSLRDVSPREAIGRAIRFAEPRPVAARDIRDRRAAGAGGGAVTINSAPNITVNVPAASGGIGEREISRAVGDALEGHAERIYEIVARVGAMRSRTEF
jgi:hypothetical protein